jgi:hypothetical protein
VENSKRYESDKDTPAINEYNSLKLNQFARTTTQIDEERPTTYTGECPHRGNG